MVGWYQMQGSGANQSLKPTQCFACKPTIITYIHTQLVKIKRRFCDFSEAQYFQLTFIYFSRYK